MCRIKKIIIPALLIICLSACGKASRSGEALIYYKASEDVIKEDYDTVKPSIGNYTKQVSYNGVLYYPDSEDIVYTGSGAVFTEFCVYQGAEVKAGDVIAKIEVEYDELELTKLEMDIENAKTNYEAGLLMFGDSEEDKLRKELYELEAGRSLAALTEHYEDVRDRVSVTEVIAEKDGIVSKTAQINRGDKITYGTYLATVYNPDEVWMKISDMMGELRYGMTVDIETGVAKRRVNMVGEIICSDDILPDALKRGVAYAKITDMPENVNFMNTSVKANVVDVHDCLVVDRNLVDSEGSQSFVQTIENGKLHRRQVIKMGQNIEYAWIVDGLSEDMDIVTGR